jgi:hypothetical protein
MQGPAVRYSISSNRKWVDIKIPFTALTTIPLAKGYDHQRDSQSLLAAGVEIATKFTNTY